jgi:hypothetical protein
MRPPDATAPRGQIPRMAPRHRQPQLQSLGGRPLALATPMLPTGGERRRDTRRLFRRGLSRSRRGGPSPGTDLGRHHVLPDIIHIIGVLREEPTDHRAIRPFRPTGTSLRRWDPRPTPTDRIAPSSCRCTAFRSRPHLLSASGRRHYDAQDPGVARRDPLPPVQRPPLVGWASIWPVPVSPAITSL